MPPFAPPPKLDVLGDCVWTSEYELLLCQFPTRSIGSNNLPLLLSVLPVSISKQGSEELLFEYIFKSPAKIKYEPSERLFKYSLKTVVSSNLCCAFELPELALRCAP